MFSQSAPRVKFQNNRFANIRPESVKLSNTSDFYSDYNFTEDLNEVLSEIFKPTDLDFIRSMAYEKALPGALSSLENRNINRDKMKDLSLYKLAEFTSASTEMVILVAPLSENQNAK